MLKLLNHIKTPLVLTNKELLITNINKEFTNIFGFNENDLINKKKIIDLLTEKDIDRFYSFLNKKNNIDNIEFKLYDKFNNINIVSISSDFYSDIDRYVLTINNINQFKETILKLKKALLENTAIVNAFPDYFLKLNSDGEIIGNKSDIKCELIKDYEINIGTKLQDIFIHDKKKISDTIYKVSIYKKKVKDNFVLNSQKGNQIFEITLIPIFENQIIAIIKNITERLRFESIAESVVTMNNIGYIFSGIRHEIGNPINNIKINLSIIKEDYNNYSKDEILNLNNNSIDEISRIEYLLWALKNFSIYEKLELKEINIIKFFNNFLSWTMKDHSIKGIPIITNFEIESVFVNIDQRAFHQVILNLISNAADAMKTIKAPKIAFAIHKNYNYIILSIKDNGIGISKENLSKIFNPFFTTKENGTGLGLVIAKRMLSQMSCTIDIKRIENNGTEVLIYLPLLKTI